MPQQTDLVGLGLPAQLAAVLGNQAAAVTAAGTTQATATAIMTHLAIVTAAGGATGAILPSGALVGTPYYVTSLGATAPVIYCPVGHTLNAVSNGGCTFSASPGTLIFMKTGSTTWVVTGTATGTVA